MAVLTAAAQNTLLAAVGTPQPRHGRRFTVFIGPARQPGSRRSRDRRCRRR
jgi:hypothetical protein